MTGNDMAPGPEVHEIASLFPPLPEDELAALADDIFKRGLVDPITIFENKILDGQHRYLACVRAGIEPRFTTYTGDDPVGFVISKNLQRRHLTASQRAIIAAKLATMRQGARTDLAQNCAMLSQRQAAELLNVSRRSVQHAHEVLAKGNQGLAEQVSRGKMTVSKAADAVHVPRIVMTVTHEEPPIDKIRPPTVIRQEPHIAKIPFMMGLRDIRNIVEQWLTRDDLPEALRFSLETVVTVICHTLGEAETD
jgi:ParB-like nuclease domain